MRDLWYADKRDLVKWGALLHLAKQFNAAIILQIALLRRTAPPRIEVDGRAVDLRNEVWRHFRNVRAVEKMVHSPRIHVFDLKFSARKEYFARAEDFVAKPRRGRKIVFVDPDTGLSPKRTKLEHVTEDECHRLFDKLKIGDVFVLYQHRPLSGDPHWIEKRRTQFANALDARVDDVTTITAREVARDVAFFAVVRSSRAASAAAAT